MTVYSHSMKTPQRQVNVPPDRFEVVADDVVFSVALQSALAVCIYDAVDEAGALLHLRFIMRGAKPADVTDTTLATELLLLDRCVQSLREIAPAARNLQAKIVAHLPEGADREGACDSVLTLVRHFLADVDIKEMSSDIAAGAPRALHFRPSMGWLQIR
jgi:chemotaxis receptor (MCP) glutamine deamidase CheD